MTMKPNGGPAFPVPNMEQYAGFNGMTDSKPSGAKTYRKTATITAIQWFKMSDHPAVIMKSDPNRYADEGIPWCPTLEGGHVVAAGDWIATGIQGEHWPIKPDVFAETYTEATGEPALTPPADRLAVVLAMPEVAALVEAASGMKAIVEEIRGAMEHGSWRDDKGMRLKDTPEWVALYAALAALVQL